MEINWFVYALIATIIWSVGAILLKFVRVRYVKSSIGYMVIIAPTAFFGLVFLLFDSFQMPSLKIIIYCIITSVCALVGYWLYLIAVHKEEISRITTLFGVGPLVTLILATIFLKEILTINNYLAFPLIIIGSMLISVKRVEERFTVSSGFILAFISIVLFSIQGIFFKLIAEENVNFVTMMIIREAGFITILPLLFILSKDIRKKTKDDLKQLNKKKIGLIYVIEAIGMTGLAFAYMAIQRGSISLVSLVNGTEALFVIVLASLISIFIPKMLKEAIDRKTITLKLVSALLMIAGLYLILI